jgi:hypothetical protein
MVGWNFKVVAMVGSLENLKIRLLNVTKIFKVSFHEIIFFLLTISSLHITYHNCN